MQLQSSHVRRLIVTLISWTYSNRMISGVYFCIYLQHNFDSKQNLRGKILLLLLGMVGVAALGCVSVRTLKQDTQNSQQESN